MASEWDNRYLVEGLWESPPYNVSRRQDRPPIGGASPVRCWHVRRRLAVRQGWCDTRVALDPLVRYRALRPSSEPRVTVTVSRSGILAVRGTPRTIQRYHLLLHTVIVPLYRLTEQPGRRSGALRDSAALSTTHLLPGRRRRRAVSSWGLPRPPPTRHFDSRSGRTLPLERSGRHLVRSIAAKCTATTASPQALAKVLRCPEELRILQAQASRHPIGVETAGSAATIKQHNRTAIASTVTLSLRSMLEPPGGK